MIHSKHIINRFYRIIVLLIVSSLMFSCGSDDDGSDEGTDNGINVQALINITAEENLETGQSLGTVDAASNSPLTYTILEQDFTNAITINANTGELSVGDASFYDFETNPVIQGVIQISNGSETVTADLIIGLNNNDDILFSLTDSKQDYRNAQVGDWIEITAAEYEKLNEVIIDVTAIGPVIDGTSNTPSINGVFTLANFDESTRSLNAMPNRSLVFAVKYFAVETPLNADRHRVKQSNLTNSTGFENVGNPLPAHEKTNGVVCFVLKGNEESISSDRGYLGFQKSSGSTMGLVLNNGLFVFSLGEASDLTMESNGSEAAYQGLSTTVRQWD